ncbi:MAG: hypothetical protein R3C61_22510 [Bacteroidia bacterium]
MKTKRFILSLLMPVFMATTCELDENCTKNSHNGLTVKNETTARIQFEFYWNHPDTAIGEYNPVNNITGGLGQGETFTRGAGPGSCWESVLLDDKKEWIYIFDADTLKNLSWDIVRKTNRGLIRRIEIDREYLIQNDFTVTVSQ